MSNIVPLTVIKGAGHEFIPLPKGENATTADFHSIRTKTESPAHITSGFYKIEAGPERPASYTFEETKYVLNGQIDILVCPPLYYIKSYLFNALLILTITVLNRMRLLESPTT